MSKPKIETMEMDLTNEDKTHCSMCVFSSYDEFKDYDCNIPGLSNCLDVEDRYIKEDTTPENKQIHFINIKLKECPYFNTEVTISKLFEDYL